MKRLTIPLVAALAGCVNADTVDGPVEPVITDVVTFVGNDPCAVFALYPPGADTPSTLTATAPLDTAYALPGDRLLIAYTVAEDTRLVSLRAAGAVTNLTLRGMRGVPSGWDADPVWVTSMWRSGQYVDMRLRLPYSTEPRVFALLVDSASITSACPQLYLVHKMPEGTAADSTFDRTYYVSADIASLWNRPEIRAVEINVANANLTDKKSFILKKR